MGREASLIKSHRVTLLSQARTGTGISLAASSNTQLISCLIGVAYRQACDSWLEVLTARTCAVLRGVRHMIEEYTYTYVDSRARHAAVCAHAAAQNE